MDTWTFLGSALTRFLLRLPLLFALFGFVHATAAAIDESKLPPPSTHPIDFARDIKPLLDTSCLKCHGAEKPKGRFRVDNREALLRGGESGPAVIPGHSAKSPLIHYVAHLVEDMEMPPVGKGDPLTPHQIGMLRAWIDQDLPWNGVEPASTTIAEIAPTLSWITVDGDKGKFREHEWLREGWNGGLKDFYLRQQLSLDERFTIEGHALRDDYKVRLSWQKSDNLFVRAGFEQFRKYFDDSGGYYELFTPSIFTLDRDLHLDLGKAWVEVGGTTPFGLQLTGGYEYHFKDGEKSTTQWLPTGTGGSERNVYPASKVIDESLHVLRLEADYDLSGVRLEDDFRYEFYDLSTERRSARPQFPSLDYSQMVREATDLQNLANAFRAEAQPRDWLLLSGGYLFTRSDGDAGFRQTPVDATGAPRDGLLWNGRGIALEQTAHIVNGNAQFGLWENMTLATGVQTEWNHQRTFGEVNLDEHELDAPTLTNANPATLRGDYDRFTAEEQLTLRNTQIPFTVLYGEVRLRQETIGQFESQVENGLAQAAFTRDTDATYDWQQYRLGFNTSPWTRVALNGYVQHRDRNDDFDHNVDLPGPGYPAFIRERETFTDEVGARLALRVTSWLKTSFGYRLVDTDFETVTDTSAGSTVGGRLQAGEYDAHVYTFNATLTPFRRLYFYSTFAYQDSRTVAEDNGSTAVAPYRGHVYSAMTTANYVLNEKTDLRLTYDFSLADYSQNNVTTGLPLGIDYRRHGVRAGIGRHFWNRFLANVEYGWYRYDEPSSGGFNDYTAHGIFGTLHVRWN